MYLAAWFCDPCLRHIPITTFVLSTPLGGNTSQNFISAEPDTLHKADYTDEDMVYRLQTSGPILHSL